MQVEVYWNVKTGCYSLRSSGVVVAHARKVLVRDATYAVHEDGQGTAKAIVRGQLEAFVGETTMAGDQRWLVPLWTKMDRTYAAFADQFGRPVTYNPGKHDSFMAGVNACEELEPIHHSAGIVLMTVRSRMPMLRDFDPCLMPERS